MNAQPIDGWNVSRGWRCALPTAGFQVLSCALLMVGCASPVAKEHTVQYPPKAISHSGPLNFCLREGEGHNCLLRDKTTQAHVLATSGESPRLVVAFPRANEGAALWAKPLAGRRAELEVMGGVSSVRRGAQQGVRFRLRSSTGLRLERVLLGSVRTIRTFHHQRSLKHYKEVIDRSAKQLALLPPEVRKRAAGLTSEVLRSRAKGQLTASAGKPLRITARRTSLDGRHTLQVSITAAVASLVREGTALRLIPDKDGPLELQVEVMTDRQPLTPLALSRLLRPQVLRRLSRDDLPQSTAAALRSLRFLSSGSKLLAGSWRFNTYFGRDTMMSLILLAPVLQPDALEVGLQSVLDRLSEKGQVAHEESVGDQAALERLELFAEEAEAGRLHEAAKHLEELERPVLDYKMVDDDFMLVWLLSVYLDHPGVTSARAEAFLGRSLSRGGSNLEALARNLSWVLSRAAPYGASGDVRDLIALLPGLQVGDWRDSNEGLGHGRLAASVNAYLVPVCLDHLAQMLRKGQLPAAELQRIARKAGLAPLSGADLTGRVQKLAAQWRGASRHFSVTLTVPELRRRLAAFLKALPQDERRLAEEVNLDGVPLSHVAAAKALPTSLEGGMQFDALALDAQGRPKEVMHSDGAFLLLGGEPSLDRLGQILRPFERAYPLGLAGPVGIYVANPALSNDPAHHALFDRGHYHGTVVWAWQAGMARLGLKRQIQRLSRQQTPEAKALVARMEHLLKRLAQAEQRAGALRTSELWTSAIRSGKMEAVPYGHGTGHTSESNALQLWSTITLAGSVVPQ